MNNKKRFFLTITVLVVVELVYFSLITLLKYVGNVDFNSAMVQVLGIMIVIIYTAVFDGWLRRYSARLEHRIASLEIAQKFTTKRLERIEERIEDGKKL